MTKSVIAGILSDPALPNKIHLCNKLRLIVKRTLIADGKKYEGLFVGGFKILSHQDGIGDAVVINLEGQDSVQP